VGSGFARGRGCKERGGASPVAKVLTGMGPHIFVGSLEKKEKTNISEKKGNTVHWPLKKIISEVNEAAKVQGKCLIPDPPVPTRRFPISLKSKKGSENADKRGGWDCYPLSGMFHKGEVASRWVGQRGLPAAYQKLLPPRS